jgi:hypothetical protein
MQAAMASGTNSVPASTIPVGAVTNVTAKDPASRAQNRRHHIIIKTPNYTGVLVWDLIAYVRRTLRGIRMRARLKFALL